MESTTNAYSGESIMNINEELDLASKSHQAYLDKDKNQQIAERLDREIRRFELGLKLKLENFTSESEVLRCEDTISLLKIIRGDSN